MNTGRARNRQELLEHAPLETGLNVIIIAAVAISVVSFIGLPFALAVAAVFAAGAALLGGVLMHIGSRTAQRERNDRHRRWLDKLPASELPDFRADLAEREYALASARSDWLRPLGGTLALVVSAVLVPYELIGSHSPNVLVEPINTAWIACTIVLGLFCLTTAIIAALNDGDPSGPAENGIRGPSAEPAPSSHG